MFGCRFRIISLINSNTSAEHVNIATPMQHQPPDKNNPSNPLLKIAALSLDKEYVKVAPTSKVRVIASLNFKSSSDLRGRAKTKVGEDVTVSFSLALKRASLEISFLFEKAGSADNVVNIERVAHLSTLHTRDQITDEFSTKKRSAKKRSFGLGLTAKASASGIAAGAKAS